MSKNDEILNKTVGKTIVSPLGEIIVPYGEVSEMIATTSKAVIAGRLYETKAAYWLLDWYAPESISNGTTSISYYTKANPVSGKIAETGSGTNADLAREADVVVSETFILKANTEDEDSIEYNIYNNETVDFRRSSDEALKILKNQVNKKAITLDKRNHAKIGQEILNSAEIYIDWSTLAVDLKQKLLIETLTTYSSTTDDLVKATINAISYDFDYSNEPNNYDAIWSKDWVAEYGVDFVRNSFQRIMGLTSISNFKRNRSIDFEQDLGFKNATIPLLTPTGVTVPITALSEIKLILNQPSKTLNFRHFTLTKVLPTKYNYSAGIDYIKQNAYSRKDNITIIFYESTIVLKEPTNTDKK